MRKSLVFVVAAVLLAPLSAHASQWTAVGATGSIVSFNLYQPCLNCVISQIAGATAGGMTYLSGASNNPITVTYNVNASDTLPLWTTLTMGYSGATASGSTVSATLYSMTSSGVRTSICTANSTTFTTLSTCTFSSSAIDFSSAAYYVEVIVDRNSSSQFPKINYLSLN